MYRYAAMIHAEDAMGRMLTRSYQDDADSSKIHTEKFTYGPGGEIATYTNPQGGETKYFYTTDGKLHRRQNPDGTLQQWRYRLDGRLDKEILSDGSYWEIAYNDRERNISRVRKDSSHKTLSQESYTFDRRGNVISYTDGQNKTITRQYDGLNRLTAETTPPEKPGEPQRRTTIAYNGNAITITNAQGEKQTHTKDALGRTTSILIQDASNKKVSETKYAYSTDKISITTTSFDAFGNPVPVNPTGSVEELTALIKQKAIQLYISNVLPYLQSGYDTLVDRYGVPGPHNNFVRFVMGGAPALIGVNPAPQNIYYGQNDAFTQALIRSEQFQSGKKALPFVANDISQGKTRGEFAASLKDSPWHQPIKDIIGFVSAGRFGGGYYTSYTGSWGGQWSLVNPANNIAHFSGENPTTAASLTRTPWPMSWRYKDIPSLQQNIAEGNAFRNPVTHFEWNGWLPSVQFQSPLVPFSSLLKENPFGKDGPFRNVIQHYKFDLQVPSSRKE